VSVWVTPCDLALETLSPRDWSRVSQGIILASSFTVFVAVEIRSFEYMNSTVVRHFLGPASLLVLLLLDCTCLFYVLLSLAFWDRVGPDGPAPHRFALMPGAWTGLMVLTHCLSAKREA
jgi:hypothetical protein